MITIALANEMPRSFKVNTGPISVHSTGSELRPAVKRAYIVAYKASIADTHNLNISLFPNLTAKCRKSFILPPSGSSNYVLLPASNHCNLLICSLAYTL